MKNLCQDFIKCLLVFNNLAGQQPCSDTAAEWPSICKVYAVCRTALGMQLHHASAAPRRNYKHWSNYTDEETASDGTCHLSTVHTTLRACSHEVQHLQILITISLSQTGTVAVKAVTAQLLCKYCGIQDCPFKQTSCFWIAVITAGVPYTIYPFPVIHSMTRNALTGFV